MTTERRQDAADWRLPAGGGTHRADAVRGKTADRIALEAEAAMHGVEVREWMSDRTLRIAVTEKLAPGVHPFEGKSSLFGAHSATPH